MSRLHTSYLVDGLNIEKRREAMEWAEAMLRTIDRGQKFDAIAFSGMSGALVGPSLADRLNKKILVVRKEADVSSNQHNAYFVEGYRGPGRYIFVDDLIATGSTWKYVRRQLEEFDSSWIYSGSVLYRNKVYHNKFDVVHSCVTPSESSFYTES